MNTNSASSGISLSTILFVVFLVLKLTNTIDWSWWWVTSPLWIPFGLVILFAIIILIICLFSTSFAKAIIKFYKS
ncbi:MAG: hypothetical protein J1F35_08310 [Erysipelotrichales bacterium]|nr:hypothetical protein [Erysipelotrichales bacterium]